MTRGRIVALFGTRPEAIKLGPVVHELRMLGLHPTLICTNQHTDLLRGTPTETDLFGGLSLELASDGNVTTWIAEAILPIKDAFDSMRPIAAVVVQGDTMSAYAGALACSQLKLPLAHVEAGLRSHRIDEPWPEEGIRVAITKHADWHYAPTYAAQRNLLDEGVANDRIHVTGNPIVSALARYGHADIVEQPARQILITMHRREWTDRGAFHVIRTIDAILEAGHQNPDVRFLWPMHPNVLRIAGVDPRLAPDNVLICPPIAYRETMHQLARSAGVVTDSGGLQEESATLGVPCAVMRNVTDRPESVDIGVAKLFPPTPEGTAGAVRCILTNELPRRASNIYGTPQSARLIAQHLAKVS